MKRILAIVVGLLILAGAGFIAYSQFVPKATAPTALNKQSSGSNIFSSIKDALSKSLSLQCKFTDETGRETTAFIKAGAVRADVVGKDTTAQYNNASIIVKDNKLYIWDNLKKQGMTMAVNAQTAVVPTGTSVQSNTSPSQSGAPDIMGILEKYKNDCKPAVVADNLFTPPTDVTFQDLSSVMKQAQQQVTTAPQVNQQQIQQYMQQYQNQAPQSQSSGY